MFKMTFWHISYLENGLRYFNQILCAGRYGGDTIEKKLSEITSGTIQDGGDGRIPETGSTYNSENIRDIIKLSKANLVLSTAEAKRKCRQLIVAATGTGNCVIAAKPEIIITYEL